MSGHEVHLAKGTRLTVTTPDGREVTGHLAAPLTLTVEVDGLCHAPHPRRRGASCTEPAGHAGDDLRGASHGDGTVERWLVR